MTLAITGPVRIIFAAWLWACAAWLWACAALHRIACALRLASPRRGPAGDPRRAGCGELKSFLVAIRGRMGSGKSAVAEYLVREHGYRVLSFAAPLKRACAELFELTERQVTDSAAKAEVDPRYGATPREILQKMGTEVVRDQFPALFPAIARGEFFVDLMRRRVAAALGRGCRVVIDDCRFDNEADMVLNWPEGESGPGVVINLRRSACAPPKSACDPPKSASHASEECCDAPKAPGGIDVANAGSLDDLFGLVEKIIRGGHVE